jgi:hypothetical protein
VGGMSYEVQTEIGSFHSLSASCYCLCVSVRSGVGITLQQKGMMIVPSQDSVRQSPSGCEFPERVSIPRKARRVFKKGYMVAICAQLGSEEKASATEVTSALTVVNRCGLVGRLIGVLGDKCKIDARKEDRGS